MDDFALDDFAFRSKYSVARPRVGVGRQSVTSDLPVTCVERTWNLQVDID
jgi:hypothetical protein